MTNDAATRLARAADATRALREASTLDLMGALGRIGGLKRAATMTPEERSASARLAARARWKRRRTK
jgi:hypothetical protein